MVFRTHIGIVMATIIVLAHEAHGFQAQATASETNVFLGQVFNVDIVVGADSKPALPSFDGLEDFHVTTIEDGKPTTQANVWYYRLAFRARKPGRLEIPSLQFGSQSTEPIPIIAQRPEPTDRMKLEQELSARSAYVGEPVLLSTVWDSTYPFTSIRAVDFHFPILNDQRFHILDPHESGKENENNATGLPVHGTRVLAERKSYEIDGMQHQSLSFDKILIPRKSGTLNLPAATLLCATEEENTNRPRRNAFQYPAYFDNTFFDRNISGSEWKRIFTESNPLALEVKPLPAADRPTLFNGMVGDFTIAVAAEPTNVKVGEPITMTITIGSGQFTENIQLEPLRYQPNLVNRFEIPSDRSLPRLTETSKIYTQTIRPLMAGITEIPPILFSFFSPTKASYVTIQSDPIPLTVEEPERMDVYGAMNSRTMLRTVEEGIRQNYEHPDMLKDRNPPLFGWSSAFIVLAVLFIPPVLVGGFSAVSIFGENRHHIRRTAKAARAFTTFKRNVQHIAHGYTMQKEIYSELDRVLRAYLGDRLHLNPGALSYSQAEQRLRNAGADDRILAELRALFALCEAYRFTTGHDAPGDAKRIIHDALTTVKALEGSLK